MSTRLTGAILLAFSSLGVACSSSSTTPSTSTDDTGTASATDSAVTDTGTATSEAGTGGTSLSGTLGELGAVQPIVASLWIQNSGETLIYMSTAPITCDQLKTSRWLGGTAKGSQVVEIVIKGAPKVADYPVPPGEVNYAAGGKSSSYEVNADSGKITFTKADATTVEGTVTATYASGNVSGTFHAEFCAGGQGY
jgi:hypothetical protein